MENRGPLLPVGLDPGGGISSIYVVKGPNGLRGKSIWEIGRKIEELFEFNN